MLGFDKPGIGRRRGTGADDETTGRDFEGNGKEDQLAGCSGDHRCLRSDNATNARELSAVRLHRTDGPSERKSRARRECRWTKQRKFCGSTGKCISISTCGTSMRSCGGGTRGGRGLIWGGGGGRGGGGGGCG